MLKIFVDANVLTLPFGKSDSEKKIVNLLYYSLPKCFGLDFISPRQILCYICLRLPIIFKGTQEVM